MFSQPIIITSTIAIIFITMSLYNYPEQLLSALNLKTNRTLDNWIESILAIIMICLAVNFILFIILNWTQLAKI